MFISARQLDKENENGIMIYAPSPSKSADCALIRNSHIRIEEMTPYRCTSCWLHGINVKKRTHTCLYRNSPVSVVHTDRLLALQNAGLVGHHTRLVQCRLPVQYQHIPVPEMSINLLVGRHRSRGQARAGGSLVPLLRRQ